MEHNGLVFGSGPKFALSTSVGFELLGGASGPRRLKYRVNIWNIWIVPSSSQDMTSWWVSLSALLRAWGTFHYIPQIYPEPLSHTRSGFPPFVSLCPLERVRFLFQNILFSRLNTPTFCAAEQRRAFNDGFSRPPSIFLLEQVLRERSLNCYFDDSNREFILVKRWVNFGRIIFQLPPSIRTQNSVDEDF